METKRFFAGIAKDTVTSLAPGQFVVRMTGPGEVVDYAGDVVVPDGAESRSGSIPMFRDHDPSKIIGRFEWRLTGVGSQKSVMGTGTIPPGLTPLGDETYRLIVAGVITDFSIGFDPIEKERIPTGIRYTKWRLLECSAVAIGCLPTAVVLQKHRIEGTTMTKEQRLARAAEVIRRGQRNGTTQPRLTPREAQVRFEGEHAYEVLRLQRLTNPTLEDRLVQADRVRQRRPEFGFDAARYRK